MGFHEDDRIRHKNAVHNLAYDMYTAMVETGLADSDIADTCERIINDNVDPTRNEIYSKILGLARRPNEKDKLRIDDSSGGFFD